MVGLGVDLKSVLFDLFSVWLRKTIFGICIIIGKSKCLSGIDSYSVINILMDFAILAICWFGLKYWKKYGFLNCSIDKKIGLHWNVRATNSINWRIYSIFLAFKHHISCLIALKVINVQQYPVCNGVRTEKATQSIQ